MADSEISTGNITVGAPTEGGCVWTSFADAPSFPADAATAMKTLTDFVSLGEISENGYTETESLSTTNHKGWHNKVVLTSIDEDTKTYKIEFLEVNRAAVAKLRYGVSNVTVDENGKIKSITPGTYDGKARPLIIDELMSNGDLRRTIVRKAVISSFDDVTHQNGSLLTFGMEFTVNEPDDGSKAIETLFATPATA
jgi:hypothetical protein